MRTSFPNGKPIVDTICRVDRFVARNVGEFVKRATEQMTRRPRAASGVRNSTATPRPPRNSTPGTNPLQYANVWDANDPKRLYKCLMSFLIREPMNSG